MTQRFAIHPTHPQRRLIQQAAAIVQSGGVVALPTDACYVFACQLGDRVAVDRLRALRALDDKHLLTLMCRDLSELSTYAQVDNRQYRFLKEWTPGAYTFVLNATKEVPRRLWHPSRKTVGLRVPDSPIVADLLAEVGQPVLVTSLIPPGESEPLNDPDEIAAGFARRIELIVVGGPQGLEPTSMVDLTSGEPTVLRVGCGPVDRMTGG